jgi:hypothetical protein
VNYGVLPWFGMLAGGLLSAAVPVVDEQQPDLRDHDGGDREVVAGQAKARIAEDQLGGYCGQVSLGHALYFGFGAYATSVLFVNYGVLPR